jgi:hypothetical protein
LRCLNKLLSQSFCKLSGFSLEFLSFYQSLEQFFLVEKQQLWKQNTIFFLFRCSDGADRLREHWDQNRCGEPEMNVTSLDQCSTIQESDHTEWRNSMVNKDPTPETDEDAASSTSGGNAAAIVSAVISTILVLILLGLCSAYLYVYGRRNPGGWAEQISQRLEAPYKRFGILDESNNQGGNENNNQVEMGAKFSENNNTETAISF